jgi:hypothetical protein
MCGKCQKYRKLMDLRYPSTQINITIICDSKNTSDENIVKNNHHPKEVIVEIRDERKHIPLAKL